jgi:3-dehydroquinate dehydratase I
MAQAQTHFGSLTLGSVSRVVGTISKLVTLPRLPTPDCDIVELRLDLIGADSVVAVRQPTIATIRLSSEGGQWRQPDADRLPFFATALQLCTGVDVELRSPLLEEVAALAARERKGLIVSYHDFERTPPLAELRKVVRRAADLGAVVKIATHTKSDEDLTTLRALLQENRSAVLCVLGMGPLAHQTRVEFPKLGSCFTYGYLDEPVAPGQPAARDLMSR